MDALAGGLVGELRSAVESASQDPTLSTEERVALLGGLRYRLVDVLGRIDEYTGGLEKVREAEAVVAASNLALVRENADVREELLRDGKASAEELDEAGFLSHDEIRLLDEEGLLLEAVDHITSRWTEALHPRDRHGRWLLKPPVFAEREGGALRPTGVGGEWEAVGARGEFAVRGTRDAAERVLTRIQGREAAADAQHRPLVPEPDAPNEPRFTTPHFVALARRRILSGAPTTRDEYARINGTQAVYSTAREAVHRKIIDTMIGNVKPPVGRKPRVFFTGGAMASGKGGIVDGWKGHPPHPWKPKGAVAIDPDKVKALMPEYQKLTKAGDPEANLRTYEEAWDISQGLAHEVQRRGLDVLVDGVGDYDAQQVIKRAQSYIDTGYDTPRAVYVGTPVQSAIDSAKHRLDGAMASGKLESARYIPDDLMRDTHARVSRVFPAVLAGWPGELELYWNPGKDKSGNWGAPTLIVKKSGGKVSVKDQALYDTFLAKANG